MVDGLGTFPVDAPPTPEQRERAQAEHTRAVEHADRQRVIERLAYVKGQALVAVGAGDVARVHLNAAMTLHDAHAILEDCGGSVRPGDHRHAPVRSARVPAPEPARRGRRTQYAYEAVVVLDHCRPLVHALLTKRKALPDLVPMAGGGVG